VNFYDLRSDSGLTPLSASSSHPGGSGPSIPIASARYSRASHGHQPQVVTHQDERLRIIPQPLWEAVKGKRLGNTPGLLRAQ
jgi:hypothetical protein